MQGVLLLKKKQFSLFFLAFGQKILQYCQNYLVDFGSHSLRNDIISEEKSRFYNYLRFLSGNFSNCEQKILAGLWKLHATCAEIGSDSKHFFKKMFLLETKFGDLVKAFRTFGVAFFWQFVETAFFCPWQCSKSSVSLLSGKSVEIALFVSIPKLKISIYFLTKIYRPILIFDCGQKMFGLLAKKFRQGGQNFFPLVHKNFRGSDVFGRKVSSYHIWSLCGKLFDVFENFIYWSPLNFSEKNFLVFEFSNHYCQNLNNNLRTFWTKTSPVCQISILHLKLFSWRKSNLRSCKNFWFSYFKQKGISDLGRNFFEISLYKHIEKSSAGLFQ